MRVMQLKHKAVPVTNTLIQTVAMAELGLVAYAAQGQTIYTQAGLRLWCIIGALIGAFCSVWIFKDPNGNTPRMMAGKFFCSVCVALIATPMWFRWWGWTLDEDMVMGVAGTIAVIGVRTLQKVAPIWDRLVENRAEAKARSLGLEPDKTAEPPK